MLAGTLLLISQLQLGYAANSYEDASKLFKQGNYPAALEKIEAVITANPRDARARFLKGLIITEQNRPAEAIKVFTSLTEDYPELPEPYNNLAVLYASKVNTTRRASLSKWRSARIRAMRSRTKTLETFTRRWQARRMTRLCNWTAATLPHRPNWP